MPPTSLYTNIESRVSGTTNSTRYCVSRGSLRCFSPASTSIAAFFSTLQDANFLGYDCILVEDACATVSPDFVRDAVIFLVRQLHGVVAKSDALLSAIGKPGSGAPSARTSRAMTGVRQ